MGENQYSYKKDFMVVVERQQLRYVAALNVDDVMTEWVLCEDIDW